MITKIVQVPSFSSPSLYLSLPSLSFTLPLFSYYSGYFNGADYFSNPVGATSNNQGRLATGAMFMLVGSAWAVGVPITVVMLILVSQ